MDFIRSYPSLLEQSRFYFPPLTSVRGGPLSDQRPSSVAADVLGGPSALTPLMMHAGALHEGGREIPLDLSLKTIRQTPDSTADDDLVLLQQRIEMARSNALQVAAALAGKKYPFSHLELTSGASSAANARLRDSFLHPPSIFTTAHHLAPPPPPLIRPLASATPTSASLNLSSSTTSASVTPGFNRGSTSSKSDSGAGSAFVTPHTALHAAVCGGLNGFCLDPRRCRLAATGSHAGTGNGESNHAAASAFHAYATALYERHMSKMMSVASTASTNTSSNMSQSGATGALQGLVELRMTSSTATLPVQSSTSSSSKTTMTSSTTSASSTSSSSATIKTPFPVAVSEPFFHPSFSLPLAPYHLSQSHANGNAFHDAHHHHNHPNRLSKDPNCACCNVSMAKSYPLSCLCCYPTVIPALAGGRGAFDALFNGCPPSTTVPVVIPNLPTFGGHSQTTSGEHPKSKSSKHHHHHHHHHHHKHERNSDGTSKHGATESKKNDAVKEEVVAAAKSRLPSSPAPSVSIKQPSPPEGGRWIPHLHSNQSEKINTASRATTGENNLKSSSNKVFAPVVRIPPSPPEGVYQGPAKTPSPHINSASVPPPPPSPAVNRPTAFTAVYPGRQATDVSTPPPKRLHVRKAEVSEEKEARCSPPKMAKLSSGGNLCQTVIKKEEQEVMWIPSPATTPKEKVSVSPHHTPEVSVEKKKTTTTMTPIAGAAALLNRVWEANYASDNVRQVPVVLAVTPMDVKSSSLTETPNVPSTHSPAEASPATVTLKSEPLSDEESTKRIRLTEASSPSINGSVRSENVVSPLVLKAATSVDQEKTCWKRVSSEPSSLTSSPAKKLKKKDVIVISMKDEHQISTNLVMKSVKRKLDEPRRHSNGVKEGQRSPTAVNRYKIVELKQQQSPVASLSPDVQPSTVVHTASIVTTTTTTTTAKFTSCQPEVVTQQATDDKNSILKLSVKIPVVYNNVTATKEVNAKAIAQAQPQSQEAEEKTTPAVRITLTKTGGETGPTAVYKSSVVPATNAVISVAAGNEFSPAVNATAAMLRRYYEDQKLRLQQAEEFNRLRFTKGNNPLTNAPLKDTLASSCSPATRPSPPVAATSITTLAIDTKPKASLILATAASPILNAVVVAAAVESATKFIAITPGQSQGKAKKTEADEAADDGDDEREDEEEDEDDEDEEEDDYDDDDNDEDYESDTAGGRKAANKDAAKKRTTPINTNHDRTQVVNKSNQGTNGDKTAQAVIQSGNHRSDNNSKRVMYNKALGETMLHRSARLGQLEHLKYYLETQSSTIDAKDNAGYSPLHECCSRGHIDAARMLLQYGAEVNSAATGGVRPIHDAVENDYLEVVRLLLSYGADPLIATYAGQTPVKLAKSPAMNEFFKGFLADVSGEYVTPILPWQFRGSARCFDVKPSGFDPLDDLPSDNEQSAGHNRSNNGDDCDVDDDAALIFEVSDKPHIPTYHVPTTRRNGSGILNFCLLHDVLNQTGMNRGAFLACYPDVIVERMARQEFLNQAKCTQIMVDTNAALQANCPSSLAYVELVHWNSNLRDILDIERVSISTTSCKPQKNRN